MNASLKSTVLLLATLATPFACRSVTAEEHHNGKHVRKDANGQQPTPVTNARSVPLNNPPVPQAGGMPNNAFRQNGNHSGSSQPVFTPKAPTVDVTGSNSFHNAPRNHGHNGMLGNGVVKNGGKVTPLTTGTNIQQPMVNLPVRNPTVTNKQKQITTVPGIVVNKPVDLSKKPIDLERRPADLSKKVGKQIDPGFNSGRRSKLEIRDNDKVVKPPTVLNKPNGQHHVPAHPLKVADGHKLHVAQPGNALADRLNKGDFHRVVDSKLGKQVDLKKQFELHQTGDLARRLNLGQQLSLRGGWQKRLCGPVDPLYGRHCFSSWYCGPSFFPGFCWFPQWSPWVNWCWNYDCQPICDPRPIFCRPCYYDPCLAWVGWSYPVWTPMPVVTCGTWVDVPSVVVNAGYDVQLLAVRFVDPGHPDQQLGPRYRVWLRNNSPIAIQQPFNVLVYASNDREPAMGLPEVGMRIEAMEAGQIQSVDLRLPFEANTLARDAEGRKVPFQFLHVIADSHREVPEAFEENNGAVLARGDILPVDPAVFAADSEALASGSVINIAGEGFGPEPGQVLVNVGGLELQAEIVGWYDLGVQVRLPGLALASDASADLVVVRGDRAASNPLSINLSAAGNVSQTTALQSP